MAEFKLFYLLLSIATITQSTMAVLPKSKQHQMASLLQNILAPAGNNKAIEMLQRAALGNNEIVVPNALRQLPIRSLTDISPLLGQKTLQITPQQIISQPIREVQPKIQEIAVPVKPCVAQMPEVYSTPKTPCAAAVQEKAFPYPYPYPFPTPMVNPFLPAASPVSAMAPPTSNLLPPVNPTQVRSHFLRKIPIPPPSL